MSVLSSRVAILAYHKIGEPPPGNYSTWSYVPEKTFVAQLLRLRERRWTVMNLEALLRSLDEPDVLSERTALLTFDDGYRSMLTVVLPVLRRFGHPAVVFVPTRFIGGRNEFDDGIEPDEPICDWEELRELERHDVSIQSHGVSHRRLSKISLRDRRDELVRSKEVLEDGLRRPVDAIAYPYGDDGDDPVVLDSLLASAGYRAGFLYGGGVVELPVGNPYRLTRLAMGPDSDLDALLEAP
jgi:peptidoglycan/xylan/chitin deacetylase (PgdA/CDA1 family)